MKTENDWKLPEDTELISRYKFGKHFFRINYLNKHNEEVNLVINRSTVSQIIEKDPKNRPPLSDLCEACSKTTSNFIWIKETTPSGEMHEEKYAIHQQCYEGFLRAIEYLKENHPEEILLDNI